MKLLLSEGTRGILSLVLRALTIRDLPREENRPLVGPGPFFLRNIIMKKPVPGQVFPGKNYPAIIHVDPTL